jgi:hypothetical protein
MDRSGVATWLRSPDGRAIFFSRCRAKGEHLVWVGRMRCGVPMLHAGHVPFSARRVLLALSGVEVPDGADVVRTCDEVRCLSHVTIARGHHAAKTHCVNGHALTDDNLVTAVKTGRRCLICHRERSREAQARYRAKKRAATTDH